MSNNKTTRVAASAGLLVLIVVASLSLGATRLELTATPNQVSSLGICSYLSAPCIENDVIAITHYHVNDEALLVSAERAHARILSSSHRVGKPIVVTREDTADIVSLELEGTRFSSVLTIRWMQQVSRQENTSARMATLGLSKSIPVPLICPSNTSNSSSVHATKVRNSKLERTSDKRLHQFEEVLSCLWQLNSEVL